MSAMRPFSVLLHPEDTRASHVLAVSDDLQHLLIADPETGRLARVSASNTFIASIFFSEAERLQAPWAHTHEHEDEG